MALGRHPMVDPSRQQMQPRADIPRSAFDVRDFHKTTFGNGNLIPVYLQEVLPGDSVRVKMSALVRLATPIVPVMDNLALESWFFFVPYRILWEHWERFIAGPVGPADTTGYLVPGLPIVAADCVPGTISDYFGIPAPAGANTISVNAFAYRAYNRIWNAWFRDQALNTPLVENVADGPDTIANYGIMTVAKRHDYFTSARPWPQASLNVQESGNIGPLIPGGRMSLGDKTYGIGAPVHGIGVVPGTSPTASPLQVNETGLRAPIYSDYFDTTTDVFHMQARPGTSTPDIRVLVNDLRTAVMIQQIAERTARVGGRYTEYLRGVFGVNPPDSRLQRPEYLGGGRTMVTVNPVAQTSASGATGTSTKLGQLAAAGYAAASGHGFSQSFIEHGIIVGLMATRSDLTYQQGLERMWFRQSQYDYYRPELAHLGEQAVLSKELYSTGAAADNDVFGYQERWADYRTRISRTSGYFRSTVATPIDMWHFAEKFVSRPTLSTSFIAEAAPVDRVLQSTAPYTAQFMADVMFESRMARPLPMFSVPGVGGRF